MIRWPDLYLPPLNLWNFPRQGVQYRWRVRQVESKPKEDKQKIMRIILNNR